MLKGVLHLLLKKKKKKKAPKLACFVLYPKIINIFWKTIYASYRKLSKELKKSIKIKVGQAVLELFLSFLNTFHKMHNLFFKKLLISLR